MYKSNLNVIIPPSTELLAIKAFGHCNSAGDAGVNCRQNKICVYIQHSTVHVTYPEPCHSSAINDKRLWNVHTNNGIIIIIRIWWDAIHLVCLIAERVPNKLLQRNSSTALQETEHNCPTQDRPHLDGDWLALNGQYSWPVRWLHFMV